VKLSSTGPAASATFYVDLVFVARDRAGLEFSFFNQAAPLDRGFEKGLEQESYDRVGDKAT
jgi:hypothetical protein